MLTVYKYPFPIEDRQELLLPGLRQILKVECQNGVPTLWALVDTSLPPVPIVLLLYGTGHRINVDTLGDHIGTFQQGPFVWHMFREAGL